MRDLFDETPPFQQHSETSFEAAGAIKERTQSLREKLLKWLRTQGQHGATDEEMQRGTKIPSSTERPRRIELVNKGQVKDSGQVRRTKSGRNAVVWVAVEELPCSESASVQCGLVTNPESSSTCSKPDIIPAATPPAS